MVMLNLSENNDQSCEISERYHQNQDDKLIAFETASFTLVQPFMHVCCQLFEIPTSTDSRFFYI